MNWVHEEIVNLPRDAKLRLIQDIAPCIKDDVTRYLPTHNCGYSEHLAAHITKLWHEANDIKAIEDLLKFAANSL